MSIKVIGVCGAIGAGKGEVALRLSEALDIPEYAFAQPLKELAESGKYILPPEREHKETPQKIELFYGDIFKIVTRYFGNNGHDYCIAATNRLFDVLVASVDSIPGQPGRSVVFNASWRQLYQLIGTDWGRNTISPTVWLRLRPESCIVNDCRSFEGAEVPHAEAESIIADGGIIINVRSKRVSGTDNTNGHQSEFPVDDSLVLYYVDNDGSLKELDVTIDKLAEAILEIEDANAALNSKNSPPPVPKTRKRKAAKDSEADGSEDSGS